MNGLLLDNIQYSLELSADQPSCRTEASVAEDLIGINPKRRDSLFKCCESNCSFFSNEKRAFLRHLVEHKKLAGAEKQHCVYCAFESDDPDKVAEHILLKHAKNRLQCPYCIRFRCSSPEFIRSHIEEAHPERETRAIEVPKCGYFQVHSFECYFCNFSSNQINLMKRHLYLEHSEKAYICQQILKNGQRKTKNLSDRKINIKIVRLSDESNTYHRA